MWKSAEGRLECATACWLACGCSHQPRLCVSVGVCVSLHSNSVKPSQACLSVLTMPTSLNLAMFKQSPAIPSLAMCSPVAQNNGKTRSMLQERLKKQQQKNPNIFHQFYMAEGWRNRYTDPQHCLLPMTVTWLIQILATPPRPLSEDTTLLFDTLNKVVWPWRCTVVSLAI